MALFGKSEPKTAESQGEVNTSYILSFDIEGDDPFEIDVEGKIVVGSGPKCSLVIEDFDLSPRHFIFSQQEDILTLNYTGPDAQSKIGKQKLATNKMYILEDGDQITCEGITIEVTKVTTALESLTDESDEDEDEFAEDTMISSNQSALEELEKEEPPPDDFDEVTVARLIIAQTDETQRPTKEELKAPPKQAPAPKPKESAPKPAASAPIPEQRKQAREKVEDIDFGEDDRPKRSTGHRAIRPGARAPKLGPVRRGRVKDFNPPGFVGRLFSLLFSGSIVYMGYQSAPPAEVATYQAQVIELVSPLIEKLSPLITHEAITPLLDKELIGLVAFFAVIWLGFEVLQAVVFGGPLGLLIQGFRDQGGFVGKRLKSLLRIPLVALCAALPIFFLPVLWGSRPLSDVLTGTKWMAPPTWRHALGKFVLIPLVIAGALLSTDLIKLSSEGAWPTPQFTNPKREAQGFERVYSAWSAWRILPKDDLSGWRMKSDKVSAPLVLESKQIGALLSFWQLHLANNPSLRLRYPELAGFLEKPTNSPGETELSQAIEVLSATLQLSLESLKDAALIFGPFIKAPLAARAELSNALTGLKRESLWLRSYKNKIYLVAESSQEERFQVSMIPLLSKDGDAIILTGPAALRDDATNIIDALFKNQIPEGWNGGRASEAQNFARLWPDTIAFESWSEDQVAQTSNLLRSLGGEALGGDSYPFTRELLPFMKALQKETQSKIPTFSQFLDKAIQAVEQRDPSFFIGEL